MQIFLDNLDQPILTASFAIEDQIASDNNSFWFGFTAGTGGICQNHDILSCKLSLFQQETNSTKEEQK